MRHEARVGEGEGELRGRESLAVANLYHSETGGACWAVGPPTNGAKNAHKSTLHESLHALQLGDVATPEVQSDSAPRTLLKVLESLLMLLFGRPCSKCLPARPPA